MNKSQMLSTMIKIATGAHEGQFDKGGKPYILHPLKVMHYLKTNDVELQCIALGHDLIEDTRITPQFLLTAGMSRRVVDGIIALTKINGQTYEQYKERVFSNQDAMRVKLCDLRHNTDIRRLKGVTEKDVARMVKYYKFYLEIVQRLENSSVL